MKAFFASLFRDPYGLVASFKRWAWKRPLVKPTNDFERLRNLSRGLYGDDRLLKGKED